MVGLDEFIELGSNGIIILRIVLVHSRLDYCNFLYPVYPSLNLSAFNIFKMDLHVLLLAFPNILTSPSAQVPSLAQS